MDAAATAPTAAPDFDLSALRRIHSEGEQGLRIVDILLELVATTTPIVHNGHIRDVLREAAAEIIEISKEQLEREREDEIEFARDMRSPSYRRAVEEGRD
jgi:uncharacterized membrane protein